MKKVAIISTKGGVGKTTTSINLGHGLSLNGKRVILLDCDPQNNVAEIFDLEGAEALSELMLGKKANMTEVRKNLFVIPSGGRRLFESEWEISRRKERDKVLSLMLELKTRLTGMPARPGTPPPANHDIQREQRAPALVE